MWIGFYLQVYKVTLKWVIAVHYVDIFRCYCVTAFFIQHAHSPPTPRLDTWMDCSTSLWLSDLWTSSSLPKCPMHFTSGTSYVIWLRLNGITLANLTLSIVFLSNQSEYCILSMYPEKFLMLYSTHSLCRFLTRLLTRHSHWLFLISLFHPATLYTPSRKIFLSSYSKPCNSSPECVRI